MSYRENQNTSDPSDKSQRALQALKVTITPTRNSLQSHTAPVTPTRPSMRQALTTSANGLSVSINSNKTPQVQQRANTDTNGMDLCPWQVPTDPDDMEDDDVISESPRDSKSEMQRKSSVKSFSNLTTSAKRARMRRSQSTKKVSKSPVPSKSPRSIVQWPKKAMPDISKTEKNSARFSEKPRRSLQPMYQSVDGNGSPKDKKKVMKTAVGDLEFDLGIEKCATEGDEREDLFDQAGNKETHLKELGPVRYSKMSEEDAEKVFEMRKRELLAFLIKLGANPSLVKKKLAGKNLGLPKQIDTSSELGKAGFNRDRVMRSLRGAWQDNISPNRFIVYNTDNDPLWNNNNNQTRGRFATPNSRTKTRAASYKISGKTDPTMKRRNSAKLEREQEDLNGPVKKNLTASFNQAIVDGTETSEARSPVKVKRNRNAPLRNSHQIVLDPHDISETKSPSKTKKSADATTTNKEEKKEPVESFTIDLVKLCSDEKKKKKKKKSKKVKKVKEEEEKMLQSEQISEANKAPSENISVNTAWESHEESIAYQKLIETMRQKSKLVLGDIDQIDLQIQKMKDDGKRGKSQKRGREENVPKKKKEEIVHEIFLGDLEEGYAQAAKVRNAKRSGSYTFSPDMYETPKVNGYGGTSKRFVNETERLKTGQDTTRSQMSRKTEVMAENKVKKVTQQARAQSREMEQRPKAVFESNENRRRNEYEQNAKGPVRNEINAPKTPVNKQNLSPNFRQQQKNIPMETKQKALSSEKSSFGTDRRPNPIQTQPVTNQSNDRNKLLNAFRNPAPNETQYVPQKIIEQTLNKSATTSSAQNYRGTVNSRPNTALVLTNNKKIGSSPNMTPTQIPSTAATSKSAIINKKPVKKGPTMNRSQQSFEKDALSDMNESTDLFDRVTTAKAHKATKSATKTTFSDGVKKILREGSKEDNQPSNPKPAKNLPRSPQFTPKMMDSSNRPKFDTPSVADIRAKIYNGTLAKTNVLQNGSALELNKKDLRDIVMDDLRYSSTKRLNSPEMQVAPKNTDLRRKRSLSPPQDSNLDRSAKGHINSMQDVSDKRGKVNAVDPEHAERLKLLGQSVKVKREISGGSNRPYKV